MDPNIKRIARVADKWMLFGLAFLVVGLFVISVLLLTSLPGSTAAINIGGVLVFLGAVFMCVRVGVIVDRQQRTITTWWGLLVPFYGNRTGHSVSQAHFVTLSREERIGGKGEIYVVFPVKLEGPGSDAITIHEPQDHDKARRIAEEIAKFLHLGIRDRSSGQEVTRQADALDQSLLLRLRRAGRSMPIPVQPPQARSIFSYGGTRVPTTIEIPPVGRRGEVLLVFGVAGFVALFTELAMGKGELEIGVRALLVFLFVLCFFLPLLIRTAILQEHLVVSPDEFVVTRRDIFGTKTTRLTSGEIEEVEIIQAKYGISAGYAVFGGGTGRVAIRSDRGSIELGAALSNPEEVKWLRDVLVHVLTSASP